MAISNAERQRRFRERKKAEKKIKKEIWTDCFGLLAPPSEGGGWRTMTQREFLAEIAKYDLSEFQEELLYSELAAYINFITPKLKKVLDESEADYQAALRADEELKLINSQQNRTEENT